MIHSDALQNTSILSIATNGAPSARATSDLSDNWRVRHRGENRRQRRAREARERGQVPA